MPLTRVVVPEPFPAPAGMNRRGRYPPSLQPVLSWLRVFMARLRDALFDGAFGSFGSPDEMPKPLPPPDSPKRVETMVEPAKMLRPGDAFALDLETGRAVILKREHFGVEYRAK